MFLERDGPQRAPGIDAKTGHGLTEVVLALSIFWLVWMTFENSQMAGRNFSCRSQMLRCSSARGATAVAGGVQERGARCGGSARGAPGLSGLLTESAGGGGSHDGGIEANEGWEIYRHGEGSTVVSGRAVGGRAVMQEARAPAASGGAKMTQWGDRPLGPPYLAVTRAQHNT